MEYIACTLLEDHYYPYPLHRQRTIIQIYR
jgi:hypothetical protein